MALVSIRCAMCATEVSREAGHVNRSRRKGDRLYCGRVCSGLGRRLQNPPTEVERSAAKAAYDAEYRAKNRASLKAKKSAWFQQTYDPDAAREYRKARMPLHVEYCRQPEYRAWKREYDRQYRAREYGDYAEAFLLLQDVQTEVLSRATRYEIDLANGKLCKSQKRRRQYENLISG